MNAHAMTLPTIASWFVVFRRQDDNHWAWGTFNLCDAGHM
jgi:hypothetical protein